MKVKVHVLRERDRIPFFILYYLFFIIYSLLIIFVSENVISWNVQFFLKKTY